MSNLAWLYLVPQQGKPPSICLHSMILKSRNSSTYQEWLCPELSPRAYRDPQGFQMVPRPGRCWGLQWGWAACSGRSSCACRGYRRFPAGLRRTQPPWKHPLWTPASMCTAPNTSPHKGTRTWPVRTETNQWDSPRLSESRQLQSTDCISCYKQELILFYHKIAKLVSVFRNSLLAWVTTSHFALMLGTHWIANCLQIPRSLICVCANPSIRRHAVEFKERFTFHSSPTCFRLHQHIPPNTCWH